MNETLTQLGVGGIFAILVIREVLEFLKRKNGNGAKNMAGQLSPEDWHGRMTRMHHESAEAIMQDMRQLLISRNEELRRIIREEMNRK